MKECFRCHQVKPLTEFYRHRQMGDGHLNKCKACTRVDVLIHRSLNMERCLEYERRRNRSEHRRHDRAARNRRYRREYPEKETAYRAVYRSLRTGRLVKPSECQGCGCGTELHAHHEDYKQPLNVVWLCARCHAEHHHVRSFFGDGVTDGRS